MANKIFSFNGSQLIDQVTGNTLTNFVVKTNTDRSNYLSCISSGTIKINYNQSTNVDCEINYNSNLLSDTLSNLITAHSWLSVINNQLIFDLQVGDKISNILIKKGVVV